MSLKTEAAQKNGVGGAAIRAGCSEEECIAEVH
jgi:hypothetical protein